MQLRETPRQITAAGVAAAAFALLYLEFDLVLLLSASASVATYYGTYLSIPRKQERDEEEIGPGVTRAEFEAAVAQCATAANRLRELKHTRSLEKEMTDMFVQLADCIEGIGTCYRKNPQIYVTNPGFVRRRLPALMQVIEKFVSEWSEVTKESLRSKLRQTSADIVGYLPQIELIYEAFQMSDLERLKVASSGLDAILKHDQPTF
jgi:5-bromo-4-chloroindolyl phosphate hydrolysis protein